MATPLIEIANEKGWWAAVGLIGLMAWRGFSVGRRFGTMEQIQLEQGKQMAEIKIEHGNKLDYLIARLDRHTEAEHK